MLHKQKGLAMNFHNRKKIYTIEIKIVIQSSAAKVKGEKKW
jgi:hypothetical protein